ncbi:MAG: hypothetical protein ACOX3E_04230 [Desulfomonilia bacterium]
MSWPLLRARERATHFWTMIPQENMEKIGAVRAAPASRRDRQSTIMAPMSPLNCVVAA